MKMIRGAFWSAGIFLALAALFSACGGGGGGDAGGGTPTYTIGGAVSGLTGTVVLTNGGADDLAVTSNGPFYFPARLADGAAYAVAVSARPYGQSCLVSNGSGTISGASISDIAVDCETNATLADLQSAVTATIVSLQGNEMLLPPATGSGYSITTLGYALCLPGSPYSDPAAPPTPPNNIFGCQNNASVVLTPGTDTITFRYSVPEVYVDIETQSVATGTDDGYLLYSNVTVTVTASLTTTPEGLKQIGAVSSSNLSSSSVALYSQDAVVAGLANLLLSFYQTELDAGLNSLFSAFTDDVIAVLPPYEP